MPGALTESGPRSLGRCPTGKPVKAVPTRLAHCALTDHLLCSSQDCFRNALLTAAYIRVIITSMQGLARSDPCLSPAPQLQ